MNNKDCKNHNVVHEVEANSLIDTEVATKVAFAEMVTEPTVNAAIVGTIEVINDKPNDAIVTLCIITNLVINQVTVPVMLL